VDTADLAAIEQLRSHVRAANPNARIVEAASPVTFDRLELIAGRKVLVVEDGPALTRGEIRFGAGTVLARKFGAAEIVDPRRASASQLGSRVARGSAVHRFPQFAVFTIGVDHTASSARFAYTDQHVLGLSRVGHP
jgi:predicted GTPase